MAYIRDRLPAPFGVKREFTIDADGTHTWMDTEDATPVLDHAKSMRQVNRLEGKMRTRNGTWIGATVPRVIYAKWKQEFNDTRHKRYEVMSWNTYFTMKLNSREFQNLRHTDGKL